MDDSSTDGCAEMCDEFAAKDKRVRVIHQENQGLSAARNAGIDAARGRYLLPLWTRTMWSAPAFAHPVRRLREK